MHLDLHFKCSLFTICCRLATKASSIQADRKALEIPSTQTLANLEHLALERSSITHILPANCSAASGVSEKSQIHELCPDQFGGKLLLLLLVQEMSKPALQVLSLGHAQGAPSLPQLWLQVFLLHPLFWVIISTWWEPCPWVIWEHSALHDSSCMIFIFFKKAPYCVSAGSRTLTMKTAWCARRNHGVWVTQIELTSWGVPVGKKHNHCFCFKSVLSQIQL